MKEQDFTFEEQSGVLTPEYASYLIAKQAKELRKRQHLTQKEVATRSGVPLPTLRYFEQTGKISLSALLNIASVLGCLDDASSLFKKKYVSLQEMINDEEQN